MESIKWHWQIDFVSKRKNNFQKNKMMQRNNALAHRSRNNA